MLGSFLQWFDALLAARTKRSYEVPSGVRAIVFILYVLVGRHGRSRVALGGQDHEWQRLLRVMQGWMWITLGALALALASMLSLPWMS